jgi:hypothetical protein
MDARRSPQRIFRTHPPDQRAQLRGDLRSASKRAGFPTPVPTEAGPMPTHEGLGADDRDGVCTENSVRVDYVTESPNVSSDDRSVLPLPGPVRLAVQVEEPT